MKGKYHLFLHCSGTVVYKGKTRQPIKDPHTLAQISTNQTPSQQTDKTCKILELNFNNVFPQFFTFVTD